MQTRVLLNFCQCNSTTYIFHYYHPSNFSQKKLLPPLQSRNKGLKNRKFALLGVWTAGVNIFGLDGYDVLQTWVHRGGWHIEGGEEPAGERATPIYLHQHNAHNKVCVRRSQFGANFLHGSRKVCVPSIWWSLCRGCGQYGGGGRGVEGDPRVM